MDIQPTKKKKKSKKSKKSAKEDIEVAMDVDVESERSRRKKKKKKKSEKKEKTEQIEDPQELSGKKKDKKKVKKKKDRKKKRKHGEDDAVDDGSKSSKAKKQKTSLDDEENATGLIKNSTKSSADRLNVSTDPQGHTLKASLATDTKSNGNGGNSNRRKGNKRAYKNRFTLFVGQLPYSATPAAVAKHFSVHGCGKVNVRLLTHRNTNKSRGMAFVDFDSARQQALGLRCHKTIFGATNKVINVERTVGGGGKAQRRKEKLANLRAVQGQQVREQTMQLVKECFVDNPDGLDESCLDEKCIDALCSFPRPVCQLILQEFAASHHLDEVENLNAWFMGIIRNYRTKLTNGESFVEESEPSTSTSY